MSTALGLTRANAIVDIALMTIAQVSIIMIIRKSFLAVLYSSDIHECN